MWEATVKHVVKRGRALSAAPGQAPGQVGIAMGGPCRLKTPGRLGAVAPASTDNFQVRPFIFDGVEWQSCEQAYQAYKFADAARREQIRRIKPNVNESDSTHGMRCWSEGQHGRVRPDWDAVKVEVMLRVNRAKYMQHGDLQEALLSTGDVPIVGAPSTSWSLPDGSTVNWSAWNGKIQLLIREELRESNSPVRTALAAEFAEYMRRFGGPQLPLPGTSEESDAQQQP